MQGRLYLASAQNRGVNQAWLVNHILLELKMTSYTK